jgi:hypothetical protein
MRRQDIKAGAIVRTRSGAQWEICAALDGGPLFRRGYRNLNGEYCRDERGRLLEIDDTSLVGCRPIGGAVIRYLRVDGLRLVTRSDQVDAAARRVGNVRGALPTNVGGGMTISRKAAEREASNATSYMIGQIEAGTYVSPDEAMRRTLGRMHEALDRKDTEQASKRGRLRDKAIAIKSQLAEIITRSHLLDNKRDADAMDEVLIHLDHARSAMFSLWRGARERSTETV